MKAQYIRLMDLVHFACLVIAGICLVIISIIIPYGVFTRYVLNSASSWPEPMAVLLMIVLFGASHALLDKIAHVHVPYKDDVIKTGTFAIAMLGGAFASHQMKHLSMDLLSRRFSQRNRLFLRIVLSLFVIFVLVLLIKSGLANIENEKQFNQGGDFLISRVKVAWLIPIGAGLMILHAILHIIIDVDYIKRGVVPPERMRSGH